MAIGVNFSPESSVSELICGLGNGTHKRPIKTDICQAIGQDVGDTVGTTFEETDNLAWFAVRAGAISIPLLWKWPRKSIEIQLYFQARFTSTLSFSNSATK